MGAIRPIRTEADYEAALERVDELMDADPGTPEADELDVLSALVERYEEQRFPIGMPSPVDAILFRMEQAGLSRRDLESLLGGRAKVSEVLAGKRPLTLQMIRALSARLGIPAEVLLQEAEPAPSVDELTDWRRFPVAEMAKSGWFGDVAPATATLQPERFVRSLMKQAGGERADCRGLYRKNDHLRPGTKADPYALAAWCWRSLAVARTQKAAAFSTGTVTLDFIRATVKLSRHGDGPRRAQAWLMKHGIRLVTVRHLSRTHLDGAALCLDDGAPVVSLTLRYDRLDNFWFCLCHELAHVGRHFGQDACERFVDDFAAEPLPGEAAPVEQEADDWARDAAIPPRVWQRAPIRSAPTPAAVMALAADLNIHPAIVAGRIRHETRNWRLLTHFVGSGEVRKQFA